MAIRGFGRAPLPGASLHVRDLCPHSLQIEQRCGFFFRDGPPPLLPLLLRACSMGNLPDAGNCRGETGLPMWCFMRLVGVLAPHERTRSTSAPYTPPISTPARAPR